MIKFNTKFQVAAVAFVALSGFGGGALAQADLSSGRPVEQPATGAQMDGLGRLQSISLAKGTATINGEVFQLSKAVALIDTQGNRVSSSAFGANETVSFVFEFQSKAAARPDNVKPATGRVVELRKLGGGF